MRINGVKVTGAYFVYDGCHKMFVINGSEDWRQAQIHGYTLDDCYSVEDLEEIYRESCDLRFIRDWNYNEGTEYVPQFYEEDYGREVVFEAEIDEGFNWMEYC